MGLEKTKLNFMVAKLINKFTNWINQDGDLPFNRYYNTQFICYEGSPTPHNRG